MALNDTGGITSNGDVANTQTQVSGNTGFNSNPGQSEDLEWILKYYGSMENYNAVEELNLDEDIGVASDSLVDANFIIQDGKIVAEVVNEDGTTQSIVIGNVEDLNGMEITADMINFDNIALNANDALNGNFVTVTDAQKYWGDNGALTVQVNEDGSVLILEGDTPMGWTTIEALATSAYNNGILQSIELTEGGCRFNLDGSIDYMSSGEIIHIDKNDIFTDEDGNKFIINTDEDGNIRGIITFGEDGKATGLNPTDANNFLSNLDIGEYLQTSDGTLVYNNGSSFLIVDGDDIFELNGQTFFVSNTNSDGSPKGIMVIGEDKLSGVSAELDSFLNDLSVNNAIVSGSGDVIYKDSAGEIKTLDGSNSFLIGDQRYFVTNTGEHGEITGMWTVDENGKLTGLTKNQNGDEFSSTLEQIESLEYLANENGDIIYNAGSETKCIPASDLIIDDNGNKIFEGNGNINIVFGSDGQVSTEVRTTTSTGSIP